MRMGHKAKATKHQIKREEVDNNSEEQAHQEDKPGGGLPKTKPWASPSAKSHAQAEARGGSMRKRHGEGEGIELEDEGRGLIASMEKWHLTVTASAVVRGFEDTQEI